MLEALNAGEKLNDGAVFITDDQSAGRGQGKNHWHATPGDNLTLSILVRPDHLAVDHLFVLNQFVSLALATAIEQLLPARLAATVRIKWPNDIYVGDRKIAGILIQNGLRGSRIQWSVIGIGLNVNENSFPPELAHSATSLRILTGTPVALEPVLQVLFAEFTRLYPLTSGSEQGQLAAAYHANLYRLEEWAVYREVATAREFRGRIAGVTGAGRLRVQLADGTVPSFDLQSLRFVSSPA